MYCSVVMWILDKSKFEINLSFRLLKNQRNIKMMFVFRKMRSAVLKTRSALLEIVIEIPEKYIFICATSIFSAVGFGLVIRTIWDLYSKYIMVISDSILLQIQSDILYWAHFELLWYEKCIASQHDLTIWETKECPIWNVTLCMHKWVIYKL